MQKRLHLKYKMLQLTKLDNLVLVSAPYICLILICTCLRIDEMKKLARLLRVVDLET